MKSHMAGVNGLKNAHNWSKILITIAKTLKTLQKINFIMEFQRQIASKVKFRPKANFVQMQFSSEDKFRMKANFVQRQIQSEEYFLLRLTIE